MSRNANNAGFSGFVRVVADGETTRGLSKECDRLRILMEPCMLLLSVLPCLYNHGQFRYNLPFKNAHFLWKIREIRENCGFGV